MWRPSSVDGCDQGPMGRGRHELSRPWFDHEARLGRRVIWEWRPDVHFGPTVTPALRGRVMVNGVGSPDEAAAARFDLDGVALYAGGGGTGWLREFAGWAEAEAWLRAGE